MLKISIQAFFTVKSKCSSHAYKVILLKIKKIILFFNCNSPVLLQRQQKNTHILTTKQAKQKVQAATMLHYILQRNCFTKCSLFSRFPPHPILGFYASNKTRSTPAAWVQLYVNGDGTLKGIRVVRLHSKFRKICHLIQMLGTVDDHLDIIHMPVFPFNL